MCREANVFEANVAKQMSRSKVQLVATSTRDKTAHVTKQMLSDVRQADTCAVARLIHVCACSCRLCFVCVACISPGSHMQWLQLTKIVWQNRRMPSFQDVVDYLSGRFWREIRGLIESTQALLNTVRGARELPASACYTYSLRQPPSYTYHSLIPVLNGRERPFLMK